MGRPVNVSSLLSTATRTRRGSVCARTAHAILVLGRRFLPDGRPEEGVERRLLRALEETRRDPRAWVLVTGGAVHNPVVEGEAMKAWLVEHGVDAQRILVESKARITLENMENVTPLLKRLGVDEVVLVTERFHAFRAHALLRSAVRHAHLDIRVKDAPAPDGLQGAERVRTFVHELHSLYRDRVNQTLLHHGHGFLYLGPTLLPPSGAASAEGRIDWQVLFHRAKG
jgi:vancomycin permeability regulator SanA